MSMTVRLLFKPFLLAAGFTFALPVCSQVPERDEIPERYKWDLSSIYESPASWEADVTTLQRRMPGFESHKGHLADSGTALLAAIADYESLNLLLGRIYLYAGLKSFEDMRVGESNARFSRAQSLHAEFQTHTAFLNPEILAIPEDKLQQMVDDTPGLHIYRHYLDELTRMRPYTLSESEEALLAMASDPLGKFSAVFAALNNADLNFGEVVNPEGETVPLTKGLYSAALTSRDRRFREAAWKGLFSEYEKHGNMLAANYEGHIKGRVFEARARGFDSALQAATYSNGIPEDVYHTVIRVARESAPALQRYLELRRKVLGLETLEVWDMSAPMVESSFDNIEFEDAKNLVAEALVPMGKDYIALYWQGFEDGWVDALESAGKRGGAFSWGMYDTKPYMSMNYAGTLNDVSTLAHEYGHSLHSWMARNSQPYVYGGYRTFIAEIASMTNEAILFQNMLSRVETPQEKAYLLQNYLDQFRSGFFRQASFADFEMQAHAKVEAGEALDKSTLNTLYAEIFETYHGAAVHVDPLNAAEWSRIPHFLRTDNFYVYQYSTSFVAATALARKILQDGAPARDRFLEMLRSGSNDYPIELLKKAGVDMTSPEPFHAAIAEFERLLRELETTLAHLDR